MKIEWNTINTMDLGTTYIEDMSHEELCEIVWILLGDDKNSDACRNRQRIIKKLDLKLRRNTKYLDNVDAQLKEARADYKRSMNNYYQYYKKHDGESVARTVKYQQMAIDAEHKINELLAIKKALSNEVYVKFLRKKVESVC